MKNSCHNYKIDKDYPRHQWEDHQLEFKGTASTLHILARHCKQCGTYLFYAIDLNEMCLACNQKLNTTVKKRIKPGKKLRLDFVQKWDFPVCENCSKSFLHELVVKELEKLESANQPKKGP